MHTFTASQAVFKEVKTTVVNQMKGTASGQTGHCHLPLHLLTKQTSYSHTVISSHSLWLPWDKQLNGCTEHTQWVDIVGSISISACMAFLPHEHEATQAHSVLAD